MRYHIFVLWVQSVGNLFVSILPPALSYLVTVGTGLVATPLPESPMTIVLKTNFRKKFAKTSLVVVSKAERIQSRHKRPVDILISSHCFIRLFVLIWCNATQKQGFFFCFVLNLNVVYSTRRWNAVARADVSSKQVFRDQLWLR